MYSPVVGMPSVGPRGTTFGYPPRCASCLAPDRLGAWVQWFLGHPHMFAIIALISTWPSSRPTCSDIHELIGFPRRLTQAGW